MKRSPPSSEPQSPASASHPDEQLPDGPKVFSDLYSWPQNFLLRLDSQFPEESKLALNNLRDRTNVVLTTSFSGMGTPEIAVKMISSVLQKNQIWCKDKTFVYASCDLDSNSQKVLMHHAGRSGSKHIFADVCGTVSPETVNHLKDFPEAIAGRVYFYDEQRSASSSSKLGEEVSCFCSRIVPTCELQSESILHQVWQVLSTLVVG